MTDKKPKIIALFGPESTGKTTLARQLAAHFDTVWIPEFAREYLIENGNRFERQDVRPIAEGQFLLQKEGEKRANKLLFVDTELLTNLLYSHWIFGEIPDWLDKMARENQPDLYFLLDTDLPWQADELRTHGDARGEQLHVWKWGLETYNCRWHPISGAPKKRLLDAISIIEKTFFGEKTATFVAK
jgi:HTH-type transcriptional regulator, transcriptional repressor of NAD biosynthesis genes